jgi:hypothetical protein
MQARKKRKAHWIAAAAATAAAAVQCAVILPSLCFALLSVVAEVILCVSLLAWVRV